MSTDPKRRRAPPVTLASYAASRAQERKSAHQQPIQHTQNKTAKEVPLPANLEAERKLISNILLNPFDFERFADISESDFYEPAYARIWQALHDLYDEEQVPCLEMVTDRLYQQGALGEIGGQAALSILRADTSAELNADHLADLVRKYAATRRSVNLGMALASAAMRPNFEPAVLAEFRAQLDHIETKARGNAKIAARYPLAIDSETEEMAVPEGLLGNILYDDSIAFLYAPPGRWKSFVALSWALCVATGTPWLGKHAQQGPVLYIACEGARGAGQRIRAWKVQHGRLGPSQLRVLGLPVNLLDPAAVTELIAAIRAQMEDAPPRLIVIDTLARSMPGGDENVTKDANTLTDSLNSLRLAFGSCVLIVHHPGKEAAKGMRGSSALLGNADTVMRIAGPNDNDPLKPGDIVSLVSEKAKDGETFASVAFTTQRVQWALEESGEILSSLTVVAADGPAPIYPTNAPRTSVRRKPSAADRLLALFREHFPDGTLYKSLRDLFLNETDLSKSSFDKALEALEAGGDVENISGFWKLIGSAEIVVSGA